MYDPLPRSHSSKGFVLRCPGVQLQTGRPVVQWLEQL